jgi:hypothetical protein
MTRNLKVERLYNLGNYINIKIISELIEVPHEQVDTDDKVRLLFQQLTLECDRAYQDYKVQNENRQQGLADGKDVMQLLDEERQKIAQELEGEK